MPPILSLTSGARKSAARCPGNSRPGAVFLAVGALAVASARPYHGQSPDTAASTFLATALALASNGDTSGALESLSRTVRRFPGFAEAHYMRGLLLSRTSGYGVGDHFRRLAAGRELERALALDRNNPVYILELGRLKLKMPFLRLEAVRLFRRAADAARGRRDSTALADIEAELGQLFLRRADISAGRRLVTGGALHFDPDRALEDWRYAENFINQQSTRIEEPGEVDRREAEDHFRAALAARPGQAAAARGLLSLLMDAQRVEEYLVAARSFARAAPQSAQAHLALGLGLVRAGRELEARQAFDSAITLMAPTEHHAVMDLSPILRRADALSYRELSPADRREAERVYWAGSDPLKLTEVNEHRLEHLARVAYADIRFSAPELNLRGWETDRGVIYIRYGPPPVWASFPPNTETTTQLEQVGRVTTVWWYPERRLRFVFYGTPGYNVTRFAGDFAAYAEDARYAAPVMYDNVPVNDALDSIAMQSARFRDSTGGTNLVMFADVPVSRMLSGIELGRSTLETGLFISDRLERDVVQRRRSEDVTLRGEQQFEERTFEARLAPGDYRIRIEAREPSSRRAARGSHWIEVAPRGNGLDISDVVLADRIAPRGESRRGLRDFFIDPNPAVTYAQGQNLHLYWEIYGLRPDTAGVARYSVNVTIRIQELERRGVVARAFGGVLDAAGVSAEGDDRVVLSYGREVDVSGLDRVPEFVEVDLGGSPPGLYILEISVEDREAGATVVRSRPFTVSRGRSP
jgi:GWxTD domain-containing protein